MSRTLYWRNGSEWRISEHRDRFTVWLWVGALLLLGKPFQYVEHE